MAAFQGDPSIEASAVASAGNLGTLWIQRVEQSGPMLRGPSLLGPEDPSPRGRGATEEALTVPCGRTRTRALGHPAVLGKGAIEVKEPNAGPVTDQILTEGKFALLSLIFPPGSSSRI